MLLLGNSAHMHMNTHSCLCCRGLLYSRNVTFCDYYYESHNNARVKKREKKLPRWTSNHHQWRWQSSISRCCSCLPVKGCRGVFPTDRVPRTEASYQKYLLQIEHSGPHQTNLPTGDLQKGLTILVRMCPSIYLLFPQLASLTEILS